MSVKENRQDEFCLRISSARDYLNSNYALLKNDDRRKYDDFVWCFSKSLPHDQKNRVEKEELYKLFRGVWETYQELDKIKFEGTLRPVNPSCIWSLDLVGPFKSYLDVPQPPSFGSDITAGEMVELYNMALLRDLPFHEYKTSELVQKAVDDLNKLSNYRGPKPSSQTLFRGTSPGDLKGPYISQFLWLPFTQGPVETTQKYKCYPPESDYNTDLEKALALQNGVVLEKIQPRQDQRYIITLRDGVTWVHLDDPVQIGIQAALCLQTTKCPRAKGIPFTPQTGEVPFVDYGILDIIDLLTRASRVAMLAAWYVKWSYFRLRPEAFAIEVNQSTKGIHPDLLNSDVLQRIHDKYGNFLLPQAYPEGSPTHPSYPGGHATFASTMVTIIKAYFDEDHLIDAFEPNNDGSELIPTGNKLRIGDELDKLASNIAFLRDAAGVHYRSDENVGIRIGEEVAISLLQEHVKRYPRKTILRLHKRYGEEVVIEN